MATLWLGNKRGVASDWITQRWVQLTGRRIQFRDFQWLDGPTGATSGIGADFLERLAEAENLLIASESGPLGLTPDFSVLRGPHFDPSALSPEIAHFYEHTSDYGLDVWSEWSGAFRPFGWLLGVVFSQRLQQLNMPLSSMETSSGVTSRLVHLVDPLTHAVRHIGWIRSISAIKKTVYVGLYSTCSVPGFNGRCVRVVFPLPNGSVTVVLWPELKPDGSLVLHSNGRRFGDPGFYFVVRRDEGSGWARYVPSLKESIHVFLSPSKELRADHEFRMWGFNYFRLHYKLTRKPTLATRP